jgi:hypothetical protein
MNINKLVGSTPRGDEIKSEENSTDENEVSLRDAIEGAFEKRGDEPANETNETPAKPEKPATKETKSSKADYTEKTEEPARLVNASAALRPEFKAKFAELPADWQQEIQRREQETHKALTTNDELRNFGKHLQREISPYVASIKAEGGDVVTAIKNTMQTAYNLRFSPPAHKVEMMVGLMQQFGIDPNHVFQRLSNGQQRIDPYTQQLEQRLQQIEQESSQQRYQYQQQQDAQLHGTIESFSSSGNAPFFDDVRPEMIALLESGRADTLEKAYEMAVWARPDIRPLMLQQQEKQKQAELSAKVQRSRSASSSITGSPSGASSRNGSGDSLRDSLSGAFDEISNRM